MNGCFIILVKLSFDILVIEKFVYVASSCFCYNAFSISLKRVGGSLGNNRSSFYLRGVQRHLVMFGGCLVQKCLVQNSATQKKILQELRFLNECGKKY